MGVPAWIFYLVEATLLVVLVFRIRGFVKAFRKTEKNLPIDDRIDATVNDQIPSKILATIIKREVLLFYYLFSKTKEKQGYSYHKKMGYGGIIGAFLVVTIIEGIGVSYFLHNWNQVVAYIHLFLSIYLILFFVADYRAILSNPILIEDGRLLYKQGLRIQLGFDLDNIQAIQSGKLHFETEKKKKGTLDLSLIGFDEPDFEIIFKQPVEVVDFLGRKRNVEKIFLSVDDAGGFLQEIDRNTTKEIGVF